VNDPDPLRQFEMWFAEARAGGCAVPGGDGRGHGNAPRGSVGPDGAPEGGGRAGCRPTAGGTLRHDGARHLRARLRRARRAERISAEQAIRKARAESRATLVRPAPNRVARKKSETPRVAGLS